MQRALVAMWLNGVAAGLRLMGQPVEVDGQHLDRAEQALLVTLGLASRASPPPDLAALRHAYDRMPRLAGVTPDPTVAAREAVVGGRLPVRVFTPRRPDGRGLVFLHGGGWLMGSVDTHDALCRFVAARLGLVVASVEYRLAPEHVFPAAFDDALAAFRWARDGSVPGVAEWAIGGDSAGGNLAAAVAVATVEEGGPAATWLLYPALDLVAHPRSADLFAEGFMLTRDMAERCVVAYAPDGTDRTDPRLSPLRAPREVLTRLGPSVVATAGFDPLRDQGLAWAAALRDAGVPVTEFRETGLTHGFADFAGVIPAARTALERAVDALGAVFALVREPA